MEAASAHADHRETPAYRDAIFRDALERAVTTTAATATEARRTADVAAKVASEAEARLVDAAMSSCASELTLAEAAVSATATASATAMLALTTATAAAANARVRLAQELSIAQSGQRISGVDESCGWIWESSRALETALLEAVAASTRSDWEQLRVLELGAGTGWLALRLAQLGADVTATDRPGATQLLQRNVLKNQQAFSVADADESALRVECVELTWEEVEEAPGADAEEAAAAAAAGGSGRSGGGGEEEPVVEDEEGAWDWVVGGDLIYLQESHEPLLRTVSRHMPMGGRTRCMLAWQERKPAEEARFVHELVGAHGLAVHWLRDVQGSAGQTLWVMCLGRSRSPPPEPSGFASAGAG